MNTNTTVKGERIVFWNKGEWGSDKALYSDEEQNSLYDSFISSYGRGVVDLRKKNYVAARANLTRAAKTMEKLASMSNGGAKTYSLKKVKEIYWLINELATDKS